MVFTLQNKVNYFKFTSDYKYNLGDNLCLQINICFAYMYVRKQKKIVF